MRHRSLKRNFLVTGMFRSGTTMIARMLHSNPNIICASDPFSPIFKSFRNTIFSELVDSFDRDAPLHDYYLNHKYNDLYQELQSRDFSQPIQKEEVIALRQKLKIHCLPYPPLILPYLNKLNGATYSELFESAVEIISKAYGKKDAKAIGFKEVWVDEFSPHFRNLNSGNKIIHIIRDPRSVVASNFASGTTYPLMFLIRQWRKIATLALHNSQSTEDAKLIFFEDLLSNPEIKARELCAFLGVDFHENMHNPSSFTDGEGLPWFQNTSYNNFEKKKREFNLTAMDKWKLILSDNDLALIELLCSKEMSMLRYETINDINEIKKRHDILEYEDDLSNCAQWIKPYSKYNYAKEVKSELKRLEMIDLQQELSEQSMRMLTLEPSMYKALGGQLPLSYNQKTSI